MHDTNTISDRNARPCALGQVERALKCENPDIDFALVGQAHYGEPGFAFIDVRCIEGQFDRDQIRKEANERLRDLGFPVNLIENKDIFHIKAIQPD